MPSLSAVGGLNEAQAFQDMALLWGALVCAVLPFQSSPQAVTTDPDSFVTAGGPVTAGATNASACLPCLHGTYSTSSGASLAILRHSSVLQHVCPFVHMRVLDVLTLHWNRPDQK